MALPVFYLLLIKAVMDGLAMASFREDIPLAGRAGGVTGHGLFWRDHTLMIHRYAQPWLDGHSLTAAVNVAAGLVACVVSLVIFEVRRVELNSYLPAIFIAPLLKLLAG